MGNGKGKQHLVIHNHPCAASAAVAVHFNQALDRTDQAVCTAGIDKYQTAKVLAAMEERGYIRREINPENKREKLVCLSEKGKEAANSLKDIMDQWEKIIFAGITPQEEQVLEQIMGKIVGNVREYERNIGREKL